MNVIMHVHYVTNFKFLEENLLVNWTTGGYFYDIACYCVMALILIAVNLYVPFGRKGKFGYVALYYICALYLTALMINKSTKTHQLWDQEVVIFYMVLFAISTGMMVNVLFAAKGLSITAAFIATFACYAGNMITMIYVYKQFSPLFYMHIFASAGLCVGIWIFNTILEIMITKRNDFYLEDDWGIGFVHLQTDIFFKFWWDLIMTPNWDEGVLDREK